MVNVGESAATLSIGYLRVAPEHAMTTIAATNTQTRDPLIRLPYETWLQCLSFAIQDFADGPLPYLAISSNWSETILSSPALWTQIIIDNGEDEEARLHTFLHLSASQLLDVACTRHVTIQSLQSLAQHQTRIRSLVLDDWSEYKAIPTQLWSSLGHPKMRGLAFGYWHDLIAHALISASPNVRSMETHGFIEEFMIPATLEEASISIGTLANLVSLFKCTHLRSLTVRTPATESMPEPEARNHFLQLFSHLGPRLVNLDIKLSLREFIVFVPYIPSFSALYSATLTVFLPEEDSPTRIATPIPKQGALNLRILNLYFNTVLSRGESARYRDPVGHILDYFCANQLLQDLHTFYCNSYGIPVESVRMAALLRCLSNARVLSLLLEESETDIISTYAPIHMPNLLELSLSSIAWLTRIETPNLIRLNAVSYVSEDNSVTPHLSEHFGSKISYLVVNEAISSAIDKAYSDGVGPKFESLRTLRITASSTTKWVVHLPSIRIIDVAYSTELGILLLDLLSHPGALPNLSTIRIRCYPCWELLFEVLRRRNTAQMHRIQQLVLPSFPILTILSRLVKLLQGHADVYTNRDIDEVIRKRYQDKSFDDTCRGCLSSGYIGCFEPVSLDGPNPSPEPKDSPVDLSTLESTEPVYGHRKFQDWGDWETFMKEPLHSAIISADTDFRPKMECSRFKKGEATISEYTLSGFPLATSLA